MPVPLQSVEIVKGLLDAGLTRVTVSESSAIATWSTELLSFYYSAAL